MACLRVCGCVGECVCKCLPFAFLRVPVGCAVFEVRIGDFAYVSEQTVRLSVCMRLYVCFVFLFFPFFA